MKKVLSIILAVLIGILAAGCGNSKGTQREDRKESTGAGTVRGEDRKETTGQADNARSEDGKSTGKAEKPAGNKAGNVTGLKVADSYSAFVEAKNAVVGNIVDGLTSNPELALVAFGLAEVIMLDVVLIPATVLGNGEIVTNAALSVLGFADIDYSENGNSYTIKYKDNQGKRNTFTGTYDDSADSLICTIKEDGKEVFTAEYYKTSFGYVTQYHSVNDDGDTNTYKLSIQGEDGVLGILKNEKYEPLSGKESVDFPKDCKEWYAIFGDTVTGVTDSGKELNFKYTKPTTE